MGLPGEYGIPLVIQDHRFGGDNQLHYPGGGVGMMRNYLVRT